MPLITEPCFVISIQMFNPLFQPQDLILLWLGVIQ